MKVILQSTTNKLFEELIGKEMNLNIDIIASYTFNSDGCSFDFRHGRGKTSIIKQINYNEISFNCYDIEIITKNSIYIFRKGIYSEKKPLTDKEILQQQIAFGMDLI